MNRLIRLVVGLAIATTLVSVFFVEWKTVLVSLGVLSIIFGLALQSSLNNLFAWFYILLRQPYRVGDRIRINDATGDVIDVGYLDTTLWEFGGQYLSTEHPSGRVIKFPNSMVLNTTVYNYSWALFPYIWNEVHLYIAYGSDLDFVAETMHAVALQELGDDMAAQVAVYRKLLAQTPVDELEVNEEPVVLFRTHENTWIEVIVRYLTHPKKSGPLKTRILKRGLQRLNEQPDRVLFPRGDSR
jgi:small-conductance mechanosensitive channel